MICITFLPLLTGNVYITWLDDVSAFVSLYKKDQSATGIYIHVQYRGGGKLTALLVCFLSLLICSFCNSETRH